MTVLGRLSEYVIATRPWSFTAAAVPILVTGAVVAPSMILSTSFLRCLVMGITVQAGANLTNTYFDYVNGFDTKNSGEKTLVEKKLTSGEIIILSLVCYISGLLAILPYLIAAQDNVLPLVIVSGLLLAFFYTANPVGLKYKAMGDVTIFLCFGPLLMQACSLLLTGSISNELYIYSIPIGMLTEEILHVNNVRDVKSDLEAGATTLAALLGSRGSYLFFLLMLAGPYLSIIYVAMYRHWGCLAVFLTAPLALAIERSYVEGKLGNLVESIAQLHLPFGLLMFLGICCTSVGVLPSLILV